ncbi:TetR/AcrR family transcriptional regulator [Spongiactinospora sp. TRM90649]|uniref:TetR/AcrR family transcriptional regulator n=1 Tax=Spongiactinospora sp. TRM90649 TaxID=3031114 RepID=UPI0023F72C36|nr:TetR/AcrR family transcriptional regulator [Spongiactinospora sp. TRM90649]MDF5758888.1 TetR/AcrR family transcriptional regulator [Spongiactinospora sp. TRM90649]
MGKTRYHHGELRNALLDAAEELVREQGSVGWSLREASARVGVSPSAAYHHFASRDALVGALSARVRARLGERMSDAAARAHDAGADAHRGLVAAGRAYVRWAMEDLAVARLTLGFGGLDAAETGVPHPHDVIDAELDRLVAIGALDAARREGADFVVWAAVHGLAGLLADGLLILDGPEAADLQTERLMRAVLTGLTQETAPPGGWPVAHSAHTRRRAARHGDGPPG